MANSSDSGMEIVRRGLAAALKKNPSARGSEGAKSWEERQPRDPRDAVSHWHAEPVESGEPGVSVSSALIVGLIRIWAAAPGRTALDAASLLEAVIDIVL